MLLILDPWWGRQRKLKVPFREHSNCVHIESVSYGSPPPGSGQMEKLGKDLYGQDAEQRMGLWSWECSWPLVETSLNQV